MIFRYLQSKARIQIWLYEQTDTRIEGQIIVRLGQRALVADTNDIVAVVQGFDEYMNLVLDNASEISTKKKTEKPLGTLFHTKPM